ncbi:hypothetical protein EDD27_7567 [Nonomuraea polychroma]|uniref:Uncharacterized protein n=1 Tax=Nonomuraea polychroma TaxID=46176 RepID=A0A438MGD2_9ACTN|nr:hypothetical protein [Nonomuraea polychroma]RVX44817.1 hypothetical protein EDD27_7567 [Nonomuraea polychroma]
MADAGRRGRIDVDDDGSLVGTAAKVRAAIAVVPDGLAVTADRDCGVELEPAAAASNRYGIGWSSSASTPLGV